MVYGKIYNFFPVSFNLPVDYTKFLSYFSKIQSKKGKQVFHVLSQLVFDYNLPFLT